MTERGIMESVTVDGYRKATRQVWMEVEARSFKTHVIIFVIVNVLIAALNFALLPEFLFFYFALIGWGVGLGVHYFRGYRRRGEVADERLLRVDSLAKG